MRRRRRGLGLRHLSPWIRLRRLHPIRRASASDAGAVDGAVDPENGPEDEPDHDEDRQRLMELLESAENIALKNGYTKIAVISGIGARNYYRKYGYEIMDGYGEFMGKNLFNNRYIKLFIIYCIIISFIIYKFM